MAFKYREELVGKRFLSVKVNLKLKLSKIAEWEWCSGVIRAVNTTEIHTRDLSVLVEFDSADWQKREWIKVHDTFQVFLVESTLTWAKRQHPYYKLEEDKDNHIFWPALIYKSLIDKAGVSSYKKKLVEFLVDRNLGFVDATKSFQESGCENHLLAIKDYPDVHTAIREWIDYQDSQHILLTTSAVLAGYRVSVYRAQGTTQWYTAVIQSYNANNKTLSVTDDTVLEQHNEDPAQIQMRLIDDGVVDSILRGVDVGITPRRRVRNSTLKDKDLSTAYSLAERTVRNLRQQQSPPQKKTVALNRIISPSTLRPSSTTLSSAISSAAISAAIHRTPTSSVRNKSPRHRSVSGNSNVTNLEKDKLLENTHSNNNHSKDSKTSKISGTTEARTTTRRSSGTANKTVINNSAPKSPVNPKSNPVSRSPRNQTIGSRKNIKDSTDQPSKRSISVAGSKSVASVESPLRTRKRRSSERALSDNNTPKATRSHSASKVNKISNKDVNIQDAGEGVALSNISSAEKLSSKEELGRKRRQIAESSLQVSPRRRATKDTSLGIEESKKDSELSRVSVENNIPCHNTVIESYQLSSPCVTEKDSAENLSNQPVHSHTPRKRKERDKNKLSKQSADNKGNYKPPLANEETLDNFSERQRTSTADFVSGASQCINYGVKSDPVKATHVSEENSTGLVTKVSLVKTDSEDCHATVSSQQTNDATAHKDEDEEMHFKKKHLLAGEGVPPGGSNNTAVSQTPPPPLHISITPPPSIYRTGVVPTLPLPPQVSRPTPPPVHHTLTASTIDVTRSVTDQIAKLVKSEHQSRGHDYEKLRTALSEDTPPVLPASEAALLFGRDKYDSLYAGKCLDGKPDPFHYTSRVPALSGSAISINRNSPALEDHRSSSRTSATGPDRPYSHTSDDKYSNSRVEDLRNCGNSPALSPLVVDRNEPINIYRDPELMRKHTVHSMLGHHKPNLPTPTSFSPAGHAVTQPSTLPSPHAGLSRAGPLYAQLQYTQQLSSALGIPHHQLTSAALPLHAAAVQLDHPLTVHEMSSLAQHQQLAAAAAAARHLGYPSPQLLQLQSAYAAGALPSAAGLSNAQLELLWQQKHPSASVPPHWLLAKHQDELIRDSLLREKEHEERERIDRERERCIERDIRHERERIERERQERDKADRERAERERIEREKAEKERLEQDRLNRERQLQERERQKREKQEKIRQEYELEARRDRERILNESSEPQAAVNQHFTESLRLASQKAAATGVWPSQGLTPSITHGIGRQALAGRTSEASNLPPSRGASGQSLPTPIPVMAGKEVDRKVLDERLKLEHEREMLRGGLPAGYPNSIPRQSMQHHEALLNLQKMHSPIVGKIPGSGDSLPIRPHPTNPSQTYKNSRAFSPAHVTTVSAAHVPVSSTANKTSNSASASPGSTKSDPGAPPTNFSLYGYQPFQHSYIASDKLHLHGLGSSGKEKEHSGKEDHDWRTANVPGRSPPPAHSKGSSVIVDNRGKVDNTHHHNSLSPHQQQHPQRMYTSPPVTSLGPHHNKASHYQQPQLASMSPAAAAAHYQRPSSQPSSGTSCLQSPMPSSSPLAHLHPQSYDHLQSQRFQPRSDIAASNPGQTPHLSAFRSTANVNKSRSQSPLHVASPQQLSAAVIKPMEYHPEDMSKHHISPHRMTDREATSAPAMNPSSYQQLQHSTTADGKSISTSATIATSVLSLSSSSPPVVAQPPIQLSRDGTVPATYNYNLIQQGLVPNPLYSQTATVNATKVNSTQSPSWSPTKLDPIAAMTSVTAAVTSPPHPGHNKSSSSKRKANKETSGRKKQRASLNNNNNTNCEMPTNAVNGGASVLSPNTTPQIPTNPYPYTTGLRPSVTSPLMTMESMTSRVGTSSPSKPSNVPVCMDNFRSFVENTVQNVYLQEHDAEQAKVAAGLSINTGLVHKNVCQSNKCEPTLTFPGMPTEGINSRREEMSPTMPPRDTNSVLSTTSSTSSIMETINRVANGMIDTDSDTLSAPSPPSSFRGDGTCKHLSEHPKMKLKKAWLQRHSDEDKERESKSNEHTPSSSPPCDGQCAGGDCTSSEMLKNCYVNCSYISIGKGGDSRSPISALRLSNGKDGGKGEESTSSASESENPHGSSTGQKRHPKTHRKRKSGSASKKLKMDSDETLTTTTISIATATTTTTTTFTASSSPTTATSVTTATTTTTSTSPSYGRKSKDKVKKENPDDPLMNCPSSVASYDRTTTTTSSSSPHKHSIDKSQHILSSPRLPSATTLDICSMKESTSSITTAASAEHADCKKLLHERLKANLNAASGRSSALRDVDTDEDDNDSLLGKSDADHDFASVKDEPMDTDEDNNEVMSSVLSPAKNVIVNNSKKKVHMKTSQVKKERENKGEKKARAGGKKASNSKEVQEIKVKSELKDEPEEQPIREKTLDSVSNPLTKVSLANLKKTCQAFLQAGSCCEITPKLSKCRECKMTPTQRSKKMPNIFCRFYAFRRLRYSPKGHITTAGFCELADAEEADIVPWISRFPVSEPALDINTAKYIVEKVGDKFCELVEQEKEARSWVPEDEPVTWKRAVTGVREMCDVCDTTLFNYHWVCHKCGFVVCLDCYKVRTRNYDNNLEKTYQDIEEQLEWLKCSANRQMHDPERLMLTQIIPGNALLDMGELIHHIRDKWDVQANCPCGRSTIKENKDIVAGKNGLRLHNHLTEKAVLLNGLGEDCVRKSKASKHTSANSACLTPSVASLANYNPDSSSPLSLLADVASMDSENRIAEQDSSTTELDDKKNQSGCSTLRELLTKTTGKVKAMGNHNKREKKAALTSTLDDIIQSVVEKSLPKEVECRPAPSANVMKLTNYIPRLRPSFAGTNQIPIQNLTETSVKYPDVPHSWLCDGRLLRLHDPKHKGNFKIFQEQWKRGQPVLVSGLEHQLSKTLWKPETLSREFGNLENDLVNCRTGTVLVGHDMKVFWDGFSVLGKRLKDDNGEPMLLKLKDWPPGDDFSDLLPKRFNDIMKTLPLPEYTRRTGKLNLASRFPEFMVRPDLGPKMYNAYGSASYPDEATTNLHLDVSDAANVMVYVGVPDDGPGGKAVHQAAALKAIDDAGCDEITKKRVREVHEIPGALWNIYDAQDADKIRDFLNKVAKERGEEIESHHDPIHDQSWYLNDVMCSRLFKEYSVIGYTFVQCLGDVVFIPAGAPHQVRNLHSCIKVAEDFVSPEHLHHCFQMTQEFRLLSDTHSNHEDKLQVKNIIYHSVKDALAVLNEYDP